MNKVITLKMLVHTTNCPASCSSDPISEAMIADDTATGDPNKAIKTVYSAALKSTKLVYLDNNTAPTNPRTGARTIRQIVAIDISLINDFTALNSNSPPKTINASGEAIEAISDTALYKKYKSFSIVNTFIPKSLTGINERTIRHTSPAHTPIIKGFFIIDNNISFTETFLVSSSLYIDKLTTAKILNNGIVNSEIIAATASPLAPPKALAKGNPNIEKLDLKIHCNTTPFFLFIWNKYNC